MIMELYHYTIDKSKIEVYPADTEGHYRVHWNGVGIGYIYVSDLDDDLGVPIWNGSTPLLNLHAPEIGRYIEEVDL